MQPTKCEGLSYPTHFLKSRGSVITHLFVRRNDFYALFASNKAKHILSIGIFRAPVVTEFIVKV